MSLSIKAKQVAGITVFVALAVVLLSAWYITSLAAVWLGSTQTEAELLAKALYQRAFSVVQAYPADLRTGLQQDEGLKSILEASLYSKNVLYAAIVDSDGTIITHSLPEMPGRQALPAESLDTLLQAGPIELARTIFYTPGGGVYEHRERLLIDQTEFGTIRVGVTTLFLRDQLVGEMRTPLFTAAIAIVLASLVAMLLAQIAVRPIHVIRSGLARLGRGELDVSVELPDDAELAELGNSFKAVTARLAADRHALAGQRATLESVVESLEDAVGLFDQNGCLLFANPAMRAVLGDAEGALDRILPAAHPYRLAVYRALEQHQSLEPSTVDVPGSGQRLLITSLVDDAEGRILGVMLVSRNLAYLSEVESTLSYSRKLAALGRLSAGIAHEIKNPLNATMIHLELLRMQLNENPAALEHVSVIAAQVRRLDEVVQGFLKFTRPEDLRLEPVPILPLIEELLPIISAEASKSGVEVRVDVPASLPPASADRGMIQQAFLNLALNACQAMPHGGRLRIAAAVTPPQHIEILFEDSGVGIAPEHLARIFDLYFTTREHGSGIGLSLVYRTVQLHDGEIEVQSVPGHGTTFRIVLRQALTPARVRPMATGPLGLREEILPEGSSSPVSTA